jgi:hypothetical protein
VKGNATTKTKEPTLEELLEQRQALALDVQLHVNGASEKLRSVEEQIQQRQREQELAVLAEVERRKRDQRAAQEEAERKQQQAKEEYLSLLEERVHAAEAIEWMLTDLTAAMTKHRDLGLAAYRASARWGMPNSALRSPETSAVQAVHDHLGATYPDDFIRRRTKRVSLVAQERARLDALKDPSRKPAPARAEKGEEPKTFRFAPMKTVVETSEGVFSAFDDSSIKDARAKEAEAEGRAVFVGGHLHEVTAYQADRLKLQGFAEFVSPMERSDGDAVDN